VFFVYGFLRFAGVLAASEGHGDGLHDAIRLGEDFQNALIVALVIIGQHAATAVVTMFSGAEHLNGSFTKGTYFPACSHLVPMPRSE
jgi:hypothetical protein